MLWIEWICQTVDYSYVGTITKGLSIATAGPLESRKAGRLTCCGLCGFARLSTIPMWGHNY